jgi:hypothetical protein
MYRPEQIKLLKVLGSGRANMRQLVGVWFGGEEAPDVAPFRIPPTPSHRQVQRDAIMAALDFERRLRDGGQGAAPTTRLIAGLGYALGFREELARLELDPFTLAREAGIADAATPEHAPYFLAGLNDPAAPLAAALTILETAEPVRIATDRAAYEAWRSGQSRERRATALARSRPDAPGEEDAG